MSGDGGGPPHWYPREEHRKEISFYSRFDFYKRFLFVNKCVNKAVVGSSHGEAPKYAEEGVASRDPLASLVGQNE